MDRLRDRIRKMKKSDKDWLRQTLTDLIIGIILLILDKVFN